MAQYCGQGYGARAEVTYDYQYPVLVNNTDATYRDTDATDRAIHSAHTVASVNPNMTPLLGRRGFRPHVGTAPWRIHDGR
ncbi:MAG: hypothetical protein ACR5LF_14330 [Symbiopectobacterium sp.]